MQKDFSVNGHADKSGHTGRKEGNVYLKTYSTHFI